MANEDVAVVALTLLERMTTVLSESLARAWLAGGRVRVDGEVVHDPERPTPRGQRWIISAE